MTERVFGHEHELTAEALRETLDRMAPYIRKGVFDPQLVSAPPGKLFIIESNTGMVVEGAGRQPEVVRQFVSETIFVRPSQLVANHARNNGAEVNGDDLLLEASVPLDRRPFNDMKLTADYETTSFSFFEPSGEGTEQTPADASV
ncbi:MAG TPA: hypothetical protein VFW90_03775 [Candidatus Saccharimonadales bacterium]|nr:hypothetical protein [Candidatus Saccharimonadales bacterium]